MHQKRKQHPKSRPIDPQWHGETVAIIASGPSLTQADVDYLKGKCRVIVVNDNYQVAPWADILYACDLKWWKWHKGVPDFEGVKWSMDKAASADYRLRYIEGKPGVGISTDPAVIHTGGNSGHQAINLAYHLGAREILLLGFDMKIGQSGAAHWFGDHPDNVRSNYKPWHKCMAEIAHQDLIHIINCSRDTALNCFEMMTIQEAIQ